MSDQQLDPLSPEVLAKADLEVVWPDDWSSAAVFCSGHSGRRYPEAFLAQSRLDAHRLRRSEDAFVEELFEHAASYGAPLLKAGFPRAYVDVNRDPWELDPGMFDEPLPEHVTVRSPRIAAGLGTVARIVANGEEIYDHPLSFSDAARRIERHHMPYHAALSELIARTQATLGGVLVVDCHSMPSGGAGPEQPIADVVLGDCHGIACAPEVTHMAERALRDIGLTSARNRPYAGGHTTRYYGRPRSGVHALQIEVNRALYMDESRIAKRPDFAEFRRRLKPLIEALSRIEPGMLAVAEAAE